MSASHGVVRGRETRAIVERKNSGEAVRAGRDVIWSRFVLDHSLINWWMLVVEHEAGMRDANENEHVRTGASTRKIVLFQV